MANTCGLDWAALHHDVALMDDTGSIVARARIGTGVSGFGGLLSMLAEHCDDTRQVPVAIETDKSLVVVSLQAAGLAVYAVNPRAFARYRERHGQSGKKSDPADAVLLAHLLRTDMHQHQPLPQVSEGGRAVKALARQHQKAIWAVHQTTSRFARCCWSSIPKHCRQFRTSSTRPP